MNNFQNLKNYALWYYFKYFPSKKRLFEKVLSKSDDKILCEKVIESISYLIDEKQVIEDKIRVFLLKNKNLNYIKQNLSQKWFLKEEVENILQNKFLQENQSLLNYKSVLIKVQNYKNKQKSINYIKNKLIENPQDKQIVLQAIWEIFGENDENEIILKEYEKLKNKFDNQKIIQKLILKWFSYDKVKSIIKKSWNNSGF